MLSNYVVKDRDAGAKAPKDVNAVFEQNFGCYIILIVDILEIFCRG